MAALALRVLPLLEEQAKARQGARNDIQERIPECQQSQARDHAARLVGTNPRYVSDAKKLEREAPALFEQVRRSRHLMSNEKVRVNHGGNRGARTQIAVRFLWQMRSP